MAHPKEKGKNFDRCENRKRQSESQKIYLQIIFVQNFETWRRKRIMEKNDDGEKNEEE